MRRSITRILLTLMATGLILALHQIAQASSFGAAEARMAYLPAVSCLACSGRQPTPPAPDPDAYEARMIELVNQARVAAGCPAAGIHPALVQATAEWSDYMSRTGDYSHGTPDQVDERYGPYPGGVLEDISGDGPPEYVFGNWMESPGHRRNLEYCYPPDDPSYRPTMVYDIGVGYVHGYWTLAIGWR